jgi:hypothetical protein
LRTAGLKKTSAKRTNNFEDYLPVFLGSPSENDKTHSNNKKEQELTHQKNLARSRGK